MAKFQKGEPGISPTKFQKGKSGNPNGRPKKLLSKLGDFGYSAAEIRATFQTLMQLPIEELERIAADTKEYTALEVTMAAGLVRDHSNGQTWTIGQLLDRFVGKAKETVDQTVTNVNPQIIIQPVATSVPLSDKQTDG